MMPEEFRKDMDKIKRGFYRKGDIEQAHSLADDLLCQALLDVGYTEGVEVYKIMEKWYA